MTTIELEPQAAGLSEEERVLAWRVDRLERVGFDPATALELALRRDVDLHRAVSLARSGCPLATARRILI